jgi:L-lactate utilization protein LutC
LLERLGLDALLHARGIEPLDYDALAALDEQARRTKLFACDLGITSATWAIAETGTLVMAARPGRERLASLLPPRHVAIIEASQILPDLFDFFAAAANEGLEHLASNVTFITGPSKTGDLELRLVTGVHGPGEWHVIIVRAG